MESYSPVCGVVEYEMDVGAIEEIVGVWGCPRGSDDVAVSFEVDIEDNGAISQGDILGLQFVVAAVGTGYELGIVVLDGKVPFCPYVIGYVTFSYGELEWSQDFVYRGHLFPTFRLCGSRSPVVLVCYSFYDVYATVCGSDKISGSTGEASE